MGQFLEEIPQYLVEWILKQQIFWVASAPLSADGHVNISPKAIEGTFHVDNSRRVWYEDLSGSGAETVAHIRENGRVTILFHAFEGPARIVRLYGKGFFHEIGTPEYDRLIGNDKRLPGSRAIIGLDVHKVGTTCGYAVPYYEFISHRTQLMTWAAKKEANDQWLQPEIDDSLAQASSSFTASDEPISINPNGMKQWWKSHNLMSLDGLPAFSITLGRGFSFGVEINIAQNKGTIPPSIGEVPADTSWQTTFTKIQSPFHVQRTNRWRSFRYLDLLPLLHGILPYLLTLVIGISIGHFYDTHHFWLMD